MGQALVIKNADFSANAVSVENLYEVIKDTDLALGSPSYSLGTQRFYNNVALPAKVKIYAIEFVVSSKVPTDSDKISGIGATNGTSVLRSVDIDLTDIVDKILSGDISSGTVVKAPLSEPLVVNAGEYVYMSGTSKTPISYARSASGTKGNMVQVGGNATTYNLGVAFYGAAE